MTANCLLVLVIAYFELHETLPSRVADNRLLSAASSTGPRYVELNTSEEPESSSGDGDLEEGVQLVELSEANSNSGGSGSSFGRPRRQVSFSNLVTVRVIGSSNTACSPLKQVRKDETPLKAVSYSPLHDRHSAASAEEETEEGAETWDQQRFSNGSEFNESLVRSNASFLSNVRYLLSQKEVLSTTLLYGANALSLIAMTEIFPLWVVTTPASGGFGYSSATIGVSTMICGVVAIFTQVSLYPLLVEWWGVLRVYRLGTTMFAAGCFLMPMVSLTSKLGSSLLTWALVVLASAAVNISSSWVLICVFVLINNSCYSHQRATVNGIGQTFASLGRISGPYLGAIAFAWSETNGLRWPLNYYFVWYLLAALATLNHFAAYLLPKSIQRRKREPRSMTYCGSAWTEESPPTSTRSASSRDRRLSDLVEEGSSELILSAAAPHSAPTKRMAAASLSAAQDGSARVAEPAALQSSPTDTYSLTQLEQFHRDCAAAATTRSK